MVIMQTEFEVVRANNELFVVFADSLKWTVHIDHVYDKGNRTFGMRHASC